MIPLQRQNVNRRMYDLYLYFKKQMTIFRNLETVWSLSRQPSVRTRFACLRILRTSLREANPVSLYKKISRRLRDTFLEASPRLELGVRILQTLALPLGYDAVSYRVMPILCVERETVWPPARQPCGANPLRVSAISSHFTL